MYVHGPLWLKIEPKLNLNLYIILILLLNIYCVCKGTGGSRLTATFKIS